MAKVPDKVYKKFAEMEDEISEVRRLAIELVKKAHDEDFVRTVARKILSLTEE